MPTCIRGFPASPITTPASDEEALERARKIVAGLGARQRAEVDLAEAVEPRLRPAELDGIIPVDRRFQYDVREIIGRLVDALRFRRVQGPLCDDPGDRLRPPRRHPGRHRRQQRHPLLRSRR